jgi:hypothetical protein
MYFINIILMFSMLACLVTWDFPFHTLIAVLHKTDILSWNVIYSIYRNFADLRFFIFQSLYWSNLNTCVLFLVKEFPFTHAGMEYICFTMVVDLVHLDLRIKSHVFILPLCILACIIPVLTSESMLNGQTYACDCILLESFYFQWD